MITTIYHVSVQIPDEVHERYYNDLEYQEALEKAINGNVDNGYDYYSKIYQSAEFHSYQKALDCEKKLKKVISTFQQKLK